MMLEFIVAEKLGYTLSELRERMSMEELYLWSIFYEIRADEEQASIKKSKRGRR